MRNWLKGGIILAGLVILAFASDFVFTCDFFRHAEFCGLITFFVAWPAWQIAYRFFSMLLSDLGDVRYFFIIFVPSIAGIYFIFGALIGLVIGKIVRLKKIQKEKN